MVGFPPLRSFKDMSLLFILRKAQKPWDDRFRIIPLWL